MVSKRHECEQSVPCDACKQHLSRQGNSAYAVPLGPSEEWSQSEVPSTRARNDPYLACKPQKKIMADLRCGGRESNLCGFRLGRRLGVAILNQLEA
jgi:hypothetical protein